MNENKDLLHEEDDCCCCEDGCGCEHDHEEDIITLTLEDGSELECAVVAIFPVEDNDYIALLPLENEEEGDIFLYRYKEYDDGTFELLSIQSDEEYDAVTQAFDEILDESEMEELFDDDEE
jgi:uncharacterized protein YrzB (UPF0473 family)